MLMCTSEVVDRELLVARGDRPGLLEPRPPCARWRCADGTPVIEVRLPAQAMGALITFDVPGHRHGCV